jgi:flagellar export protein FliJ
MKHAVRSRVDMRGFPWKLAGVERKLELELEQATATLAVLQRQAAALREQVQKLESEGRQQARSAGDALARGFDVAAHGRWLRYLAHAQQRLVDASGEVERGESRVTLATQACTEADRRLACLRTIRESAEKAYAAEQLRRQAKEADLAWLVRLAVGRRVHAPREVR